MHVTITSDTQYMCLRIYTFCKIKTFLGEKLLCTEASFCYFVGYDWIWNLSRKCRLLLDNDHWCMTGKQMRCVSCQSLLSHIKCWMTDWFQLERCYVTPMHCSHKIIKVLIITKLPQKITCLCNITRNAKLGKFHIGHRMKIYCPKLYISVI